MAMKRIILTAQQAAAINARLVDYTVAEGDSVPVRVDVVDGVERLFHKASVPGEPLRPSFDVELPT